MNRQQLIALCKEKYDISPDYPFSTSPDAAVLRHPENRKWFALVMQVSKAKFGLDSNETIDVVNLKIAPEIRESFGKSDGVYPAYHMNKSKWISVLLDGSAQDDTTEFLIEVSYQLTDKKS
ncbi:MAG: MmcQ/YjbR family DNA-binding protein [Clostridia bacterium]|nr:MmcQ/YjbR family DNA-binding protein [Clostridia bacterium]